MKTSIIDNPSALYWASFNRFELRLSGEAVCAYSHSGSVDADVAHFAPIVRAQMSGPAGLTLYAVSDAGMAAARSAVALCNPNPAQLTHQRQEDSTNPFPARQGGAT